MNTTDFEIEMGRILPVRGEFGRGTASLEFVTNQTQKKGGDYVATFRLVIWNYNHAAGRSLITDIFEQEIWIKEKHLKDPRFWKAVRAGAVVLEDVLAYSRIDVLRPNDLLSLVFKTLDLKSTKSTMDFIRMLTKHNRLGRWLK